MSLDEQLDAQLRRQADEYLTRWSELVKGAGPDAIAFTGQLTHGGGWRGPDADNDKVATMTGAIEAVYGLATDIPSPGQVTWADGSSVTVPLFSASEALADLIAEAGGGDCGGCRPVEVTGAKLVTRDTDTSRGPATTPVWQFEFVAKDAPRTPLTHVAVRNRILVPLPEWNSYGGNPAGQPIFSAYGASTDTELTVMFVGAPHRGDQPCGADYTAEAIESDLAIVVIVHGASAMAPDSPSPQACPALGSGRTAKVHLDAPLGDRAVLEVQFGTPVVVLATEPPEELLPG